MGAVILTWMFVAVVLAGIGAALYLILWSFFRHWFVKLPVVHLSTAVILMFAAGALMWANMAENGPQGIFVVTSNKPTDNDYKARVLQYGWPLQATRQYKPVLDGEATGSSFTNPLVAINVGIALTILYAVWFGCEWWIRSRASRRERQMERIECSDSDSRS